MNRFRANCFILCLLLLLFIVGGASQPVLAKSHVNTALIAVEPGQPPLPPPPNFEESIKLEAKYPTLRGHSGSTYEFEVYLNYLGREAREIRLSATTPEGFLIYVYPSYAAKGYEPGEISSVFLEANRTYPEIIKVWVSPIFYSYTEKLPMPGEYVITLTGSTADEKLKASIDLKVVITGKYAVEFRTGGALEGRLNAQVTAGKDNHIIMVVANTGTAPVEKVTFSSEEPGGWNITFEPNEIDSIAPEASCEVDVDIKPSGEAIAADYEITLKVDTKDNLANDELDIRVTVLKPTVWGWVGVGIVLLVVAGLAVIFMRLGRR